MTHDNIDILVVDDDISHCTILFAGFTARLGL